MIRAAAGDDFLLIAQRDHALLSGAMAAHVGNERFQPLSLEAIAGISHHDAGWPLHDDAPTLNPRGVPLNVFESPSAVSVAVWTESVRRAAEDGPYAQLLVSIHVLSLSSMALTSGSIGRADQFALLKFQQQEVERQAQLRTALGLSTSQPLHNGLAQPSGGEAEERLAFDYGWLRALDRLSLETCFGGGMFKTIDSVRSRPTTDAITLELASSRSATFDSAPKVDVSVDPWPFDTPDLTFEMPFVRLPTQPFQEVAAFRSAYTAASRGTLVARLRRR